MLFLFLFLLQRSLLFIWNLKLSHLQSIYKSNKALGFFWVFLKQLWKYRTLLPMPDSYVTIFPFRNKTKLRQQSCMERTLLRCSTNPADGAGVHQRSFCGALLVGALRFLLLCCLLSIFLLRLNLLLPTSHGPHHNLENHRRQMTTFLFLYQFYFHRATDAKLTVDMKAVITLSR